MPAFDLPAGEIDALAAFVHSLNAPVREKAAPGDAAAGERYFFSQGRCAQCHMVDGRGSPLGPDLSEIGNTLNDDQLRESLLNPSAQISPGYGLVTVRTRDGKTVRGFARDQSGIEIVVEDLQGKFHLLASDKIATVRDENNSLMPAIKANPRTLQNLIAYLSGLKGVKPGVAKGSGLSQPDGIPWQRLLHPEPADWITYNGQLSGNRYSKPTQINSENVSQLHLKWIFTIPIWEQVLPDTTYIRYKYRQFGLETTPLVADGIMYATGPNQAYALDAHTGQRIWRYWRLRPPQPNVGDAAVGKNRGVAVSGNNVFMETSDAHLIALNRTTGKLAWEQAIAPKGTKNYGATAAPLAIKKMVIAGISGGDWPDIQGFIAAYNASSGKLLWKFNAIPKAGDPAAATWGEGLSKGAGGGATWLTGSYDPETNTLYWTTGNPYPDSNGQIRPGDNLYTNCILALDPDNGKLKWYYQVTPHDIHDWDANAPVVLIDTKYQGTPRKLLLFSNKNGLFYALDRTNGHVLLAKPFVRVNWASGIGPDGRAKLLPQGSVVCPALGTNWKAKAFSPKTGLYYVTALEGCEPAHSSRGKTTSGAKVVHPVEYLRALNIETGKVAWQVPQVTPETGLDESTGVLATAGGILLYGNPTGDLVAVDARNGKTLWHFKTNGPNRAASPMTYMVDGQQYVAYAVGPNILCFSLRNEEASK
jgi:PQQ-dependent dehydrogenase (methanol/ethanol family)